MDGYRKVIAVCGVWLYEEKEYSFIAELNRMCKKMGYVAVAFNFSIDSMTLEDDVLPEKRLLHLLEYFECNAVIIMGETIKGASMYQSIKNTINKKKVPVFSLDCEYEDAINISMCFGDGFKNMLKHVVEHHHCKKINMIAGIKENEFSIQRVNAYKEVLKENGIPFEEKRLAYGDFWSIPARKVAEKFLEDEDLPDAIVCANDVMAIAACEVLTEHGIKVPEDVIVTGFDGLESANINYPSISTVAPDYEQEVQLIFDLLEKIENGEDINKKETKKVDFKLLPSQSCGCGNEDVKKNRERVRTLSTLANDQKWHMMALNKMLLHSTDMERLSDMTPLLDESVELWIENMFFVAVYEKIYYDSEGDPGYDSYYDKEKCVSMLRIQNEKHITNHRPFNEKTIMPDLKEAFRFDSGYEMFMIRLLNTRSNLYGYLFEGFKNVDARSMRRCEEFGLFLSTAITLILKNKKLIQLNEKLKSINKVMEQASIRDYLTGLYNRRGFYDELYKLVESEENRNKYLTFFSIDMDGLKYVNDTFGHKEGDFALKTLASAIRHFAKRNGICARYGGDEFVCAIITDQETNFDADTIRARFKSSFDKDRDLFEKPYTVEASVGCRCHKIDHELDLDELMRNSDEDMYKDKSERKKSRQ